MANIRSGYDGPKEVARAPLTVAAMNDDRELPSVPRGEIVGERRGGRPADEAEHFYRCQECGGYVDKRDLGMVFDHEPGGSHPKADQVQ